MSLSLYDQPAQSNVINTYVAEPYQEILQAGLAKQGRYDETLAAMQANQEYLDQLQAIEGTVHEDYLNKARTSIGNIASGFANKDLSDPFIRRQLRDEIRRKIDPATISRITESKKNYDTAQKMKAELDMRGLYFEPYDKMSDPALTGSLSLNDTYNYTPRAFQDPEKVAGSYFESINPDKRIVSDESTGMITEVTERSLGKMRDAVSSNWRTFADTPQGQWVVQQYRQRSGDKSTTDESIVKGYLDDVAKRYAFVSRDYVGAIPGWAGRKSKEDTLPINASNNTQKLPNLNLQPNKEVKKQIGFDPSKVEDVTDLITSGKFDEDGNYIGKQIEGIDDTAAGEFKAWRQERIDKKTDAVKQLINKVKTYNSGELSNLSDAEALTGYIQAYNKIKDADYNTYLYETDEVSTSKRENLSRQITQDLGGRNLVISETGKDAMSAGFTLDEIYDKYGVTKDKREKAFESIKVTSIVPALGGYQASMIINGQPKNFIISPNKTEQQITSLMVEATKKHMNGDVGEKKVKDPITGREFYVDTILKNGDDGFYYASRVRSIDGKPLDQYTDKTEMPLDLYETHVANILQFIK